MAVRSAKELNVYKKAYRLSMLVFEISKKFPSDERYVLTVQSIILLLTETPRNFRR